MSLLQAFLQAIDSLATGAAPADRLRFPLRDADQATLTSATVSDGGTARPDRLVLELEPDTTAGAGPPEILPLFPGFVTFAADDPDASKAVPDPDDPGFDWTDPAAWPTQGRLRVDLDRPALETLMAKAGAAFPVVPTRADYWPVVLPPDWLTEDAVRALAERKTVRRTGHPAVPHGTARWRKHALAAFLAGEHRLRVAPPPDDDHRADFAFPTAPLDANGKATLTFALSRPVAEPDDGAAAEVAAAAGTLTPAHPDHPLNQELPVRRVLQALRGELGSAGALALEVTADWPLGPRWFGVATGTPGEPATPPYALGALAEQAVEVRAGATLLQQRQLPLHGLISVAQHRGSAAAEPSPPTLTVSFPGGPLSVAGTNVADPGDATRLLADLAAEPAPWAALMPALPAARAALVSRCAAITKCQRTRRAVTDHLHDYARRIRPAAWNGDTRAGPAFDEIFHGSRTPWSYIDAAAFERLFAAVELVGFTDPAHPVTVRRPPHALLLWLMEGLLSERSAKVIRPGWRTLTDIGVGWLVNFSPAEVAAATPGQIRTTVRVAMFWAFYGLDINNWHVPGVADNQPRLNSPIADTVANHDEAWRVANAAIVAAGIQPPDRAAVNATIAVRHNPAPAGRWEFKLAPGFGAAMLACQYAEYLRRLVALPAAAQPYASFPYAAYNGNPTRVTNQFFNPAAAEIAADPAKWSGKDHEDVLMSRRLAGTEVSRGSPPPPRERSIDPKVQILHVAALADAWARHLPATWPAP